MKKTGLLIIILSVFLNVNGQDNQTLSEKLWEQVQSCYSMFEDMDGDGQVDYDEIIDDSRNGYLKVAGSWPTCGCRCENTVGAYRINTGGYVFIKKSAWSCSWEKMISSSESLMKIFPFDFEVDGFFSRRMENSGQYATFYIDLEIPRKGTDTKVTINLIPFGLNIESVKILELSYSEVSGKLGCNHLYPIMKIARKIQNEETLQYLLKAEFDKISKSDMKLVHEAIDGANSWFENKEDLVTCLQNLKQKYDLYTEIKHQWLILGWNRTKGEFFIKEKGEKPENITFKEFLKKGQYWSPVC